MDKRWAIAYAFAISFFATMYLTVLPDVRIVYLPAIGLAIATPIIYFLERKHGEIAFEPYESRVPKRQAMLALSLALACFLIFNFIYVNLPSYSFAAQFYVGLTIAVLAYSAFAFAGGVALKIYDKSKMLDEVIWGLVLTVALGVFSIISAVLGVVIIPYAVITYPYALWALFFLLWAVLAAIAEELAFRYFLAPAVASGTGIALSSVIVSITFAVYHWFAYGADPLSIAYLFTMSFILTVVALYRRSLMPALVAHVLNNVLASIAYISPALGVAMLGAVMAPLARLGGERE